MHASRDSDHRLAHSYHGSEFQDRLPIRPTMLSHLAYRAEHQGAEPFLTIRAEDGGETTLAYREMDLLSRRVAAWAGRELDARPGDTFGLAPVNDVVSVVAVFGLLRAGCSILSLNPGDPAGRIAQQTAALRVKGLLKGPAVTPAVDPDSPADWTDVPDPMGLPDPDADWKAPALDPGADALYFGTSGSTAASKLVAQSHYNAAVNADALRRHHGLGPGDRFLGCLPIHHVNGLHFSIFGTLAAGAHGIVLPRFSPFEYPRLLNEYRPRVASVVPSILETLLETWRSPRFPTEFDYFVSAAAPLSTSTARAVHDRWDKRVLQGYGLTETTNFSTTMPRDLPDELYRRLMLDPDIPSIGAAVHGNEVAVLTEDGSRAETGRTGEICMRGHNVMMRYQGNEEATSEAFQGGWFHSQDLGYEIVDPKSGMSFFVITGRSKNIAKVRGETVSLEEMERALKKFAPIRDAACAAVPDRFLGEVIVAAVSVSGSESEEIPDADILTHLKSFFDPAVLPARIVRMASIPRTATGKVIRPELKNSLAAAAQDS